MPDTTAVATKIAHWIARGVPEPTIIGLVMRRFPELTRVELAEALQDAVAVEERRRRRRH